MLHQVLAYDLARQKRVPFAVASVDAAQCYNRISHAMMALSSRAGKVPKSACNSLLQPLREMEFFVRTGYGESETFIGVKTEVKQGGSQSNGGAPGKWQQMSSVMMGAHKRKGHGVTITTPISKKSTKTAGILFVDNTNL